MGKLQSLIVIEYNTSGLQFVIILIPYCYLIFLQNYSRVILIVYINHLLLNALTRKSILTKLDQWLSLVTSQVFGQIDGNNIFPREPLSRSARTGAWARAHKHCTACRRSGAPPLLFRLSRKQLRAPGRQDQHFTAQTKLVSAHLSVCSASATLYNDSLE